MSDAREYRRRIRAWTMYDWANSAFATTIIAAVLPVYYGTVAGATLPNPATATAYWSLSLSVSLFVAALVSPILGTVSDVMRGKKKFLAVFTGAGVVSSGLLMLVSTGDWLLASILFMVGRFSFTSATVFYDSLLPHVAKPEDRDRVSSRGYAIGYLGGGVLLAVNAVMIGVLPGTWGPRLSFLSVGLWWALFSIPIFRSVPEPPAEVGSSRNFSAIMRDSFSRLATTFRDMSRYRDLFMYLLAYLIYIDGVGTIIGMAGIYGSELNLGRTELILALLLVQFVGIPASLIFGRLPDPRMKRRPFVLAFVLASTVLLPVAGIAGSYLMPETMRSGIGWILGLILCTEAVAALFAFAFGNLLFRNAADMFTTKRTIYLALVVYSVIAVWGFFMRSIIEFWFIAWMVAFVQGGSQALSRSLYASMVPASKSGEFFGLFGVMEKFASFFGPMLFALSALLLGSSRPAVLSIVAFFVVGMILLSRVDAERGRRVAEEDERKLSGA